MKSGSAARVAVLQPRFDSQGGAEKYAAYIADTFARRGAVDAVTEHEVDRDRLSRSFGLKLEGVRFRTDPRVAPRLQRSGRLSRLLDRRRAARQYASLTSEYDIVLGVTQLAPWRSDARRSVLLVHFPVVREQRVRPEVPASPWTSAGRQQLDLRRRLRSWDRIICNSEFTRRHIRLYWDREAEIIHPPIELPPPSPVGERKPWILTAGFFSKPDSGPEGKWSYKRQELMIKIFRSLCDEGLTGWELHLAGHVLPPEPSTFEYLDSLKHACAGYPIRFHEDCPHEELLSLYRQSAILWHAAGYGVDPEVSPERTEHFGMVTAEAMGWGCVPVVIHLGGQPEIVEDGRSGKLWNSPEECASQTLELIRQPGELRRLAEGAIERAQLFGLERFRRQWAALLDEELARLLP